MYYVVALLGGVAATALVYRAWAVGGFWTWASAVLLGLVTLGTLGLVKSRTGPCPACGGVLPSVEAGGFGACSSCSAYVTADATGYWIVEEDTVAQTPVFEVTVPETFRMPALCSACGGAATRVVDVIHHETQTGRDVAIGAASLALGRLVIRTGGGTKWTLQVPHCDAHESGAAIEKTMSGLKLKAASLRFCRAFAELNPPTPAGCLPKPTA
jgi:hypothetical protein